MSKKTRRINIFKIMKRSQYDPTYYMLNPLKDYLDFGYKKDVESFKSVFEEVVCTDDFISPTLVLDLAGLLPAVGIAGDAASLVLNLHCGKLGDAFLSALAMFPIAGAAATAIKYVGRLKNRTLSQVGGQLISKLEGSFASMSEHNIRITEESFLQAFEKIDELLLEIERAFAGYQGLIQNSKSVRKYVSAFKQSLSDSVSRVLVKSNNKAKSSREIAEMVGKDVDMLEEQMNLYRSLDRATRVKLVSMLSKSINTVADAVINQHIRHLRNALRGFEDPSKALEYRKGVLGFLYLVSNKVRVVFDEDYSQEFFNSPYIRAAATFNIQDPKITRFTNYNEFSKEFSKYCDFAIEVNLPAMSESIYLDLKSGNVNVAQKRVNQIMMEELDHILTIATFHFDKAINKVNPSNRVSDYLYKNIYGKLNHAYRTLMSKSNLSLIASYTGSTPGRVSYILDPVEVVAALKKMDLECKKSGMYKGADHNVSAAFIAEYLENSSHALSRVQKEGFLGDNVIELLGVLSFLQRRFPTEFREILEVARNL